MKLENIKKKLMQLQVVAIILDEQGLKNNDGDELYDSEDDEDGNMMTGVEGLESHSHLLGVDLAQDRNIDTCSNDDSNSANNTFDYGDG